MSHTSGDSEGKYTKADRLALLRRPYSDDTTPQAQRFLNGLIRNMSSENRAKRFSEVNRFARQRMIEGYLHRDPALTHRQAELKVIHTSLGDELFAKVYGDRR